jgi:hypothetical protein
MNVHSFIWERLWDERMVVLGASAITLVGNLQLHWKGLRSAATNLPQNAATTLLHNVTNRCTPACWHAIYPLVQRHGVTQIEDQAEDMIMDCIERL